jgi:hypothetical protein
MSSVSPLAAKYSSLFSCVLSCFDRVLFKGRLPLSYPEKFQSFVDSILKLPRADFVKRVAPTWSKRLVEHAQHQAERQQRPWLYHLGWLDKDAWAKEQRRRDGIREGLIGILCVQEKCPTFKLAYGQGKPHFVCRSIPQRVLYYYFQDCTLGLIHVRVQTWAPFTCQVYVNGHDFLAQQLRRRHSDFTQQDNAFTQLADPALAQRQADRFVQLPWPKLLERYARMVNPLLRQELAGLTHYWCIEQAEYATDLLFADRDEGGRWYRQLTDHAVLRFDPKQVFAFLGRRFGERYQGEAHTRSVQRRELGMCVRHSVGRNSLKMYDKGARLLRLEMTIHQPKSFRVLRTCHHRDGTSSRGYHALCKGVGNLHHYQRLARACLRRYEEALVTVAEPATLALAQVRQMTEPCRRHGRPYAGFNPARADDYRHLAALLCGDGIARGFRNRDLRRYVHGPGRHADEPRAQAAMSRFVKRCQVRGWIAKIPRSQRWRVTTAGRTFLSQILTDFRAYAPLAA